MKDIKKKNNYTHWLFWWVLDEDELDKQVREYKDLDIWHSVRKISALLLLFVAAITICGIFFNWFDSSAWADVVVALIIAFFVYRGHRWAMIAAMLFWTFEKLYFVYTNYSTSTTLQTSPIVQIIWWTVFMHVFYEAFKVEQLRRRQNNSE